MELSLKNNLERIPQYTHEKRQISYFA